ncbi:hypothetical protein H109_02214 [Trichophyton interdigitale MR816]|uniref:Uncharacterized protein n=1 Tax=Trichophyton interdigitale (strain MR816) TaxID=1215338 RepID=A0A059JDQ1_TRIIM|nr:hypothetical protein H101_07034 [Trichophyton interdigitale H6]KDB26021.1 hypothetical protein H109_02214 [Trichophyton interdigitale MR816]
MAYYEPQGWQAPMRQASWEASAPPSRSGIDSHIYRNNSEATTWNELRLIQLVVGGMQALARPSRENPSPTPSPLNSMNDDANCDGLIHEEVERAIDNLSKSGKTFGGLPRRDSMPMMMGRPYDFTDPRAMGPMAPSRHHSIGDYDAMRPHSASNLQGFYAAQRFQGRPNETEQMIQAKRRLAAQRERELRNYHQEQQYNRSLLADISGDKSDRSMSPAAMTEESRRDLIARQHRALYGNDSALQTPSAGPGDDSHSQAAGTPTTGLPSAGRGASPRGVDPFLGGQPHADSQAQQATSGANVPCSVAPRTRSPPSTASPPSNTNPGSTTTTTTTTTTTYGGVFEPSQPPTSSPTGKGTTDSSPSRVGPIGSRPAQPHHQQQSQQPHQPQQQQQQQQQPPTNQSPNPSLSLRSTTPLPSPLSYGFSPNEDGGLGSSTTVAATSATGGGANNGSNGNNGSGNGTGTDAGAGSATQSSSAAATSRSASGNNSTSQSMKESSPTVGLGWGWRGKNQLGVQASVWG